MKKTIRSFVCLSAVFTATLFTSCSSSGDDSTPPAVVKPDLVFYGLTSTNSLVKYNANNSTTAISSATITGLQSGETILAIDFRPVTGQLYGLGSTSRLYVIHPASGIAKEIGVGPFAQVLSGTLTGFDFNPTVDRIRVVTSSGLNFRLNPETGAVAGIDTNLNPGTPNIGSAAYTNNTWNATTTELFTIDFSSATLYKQNPPNAGVLAAIGSLGVPSITGDGGFDISPSGVALANFTTSGMNHLFQINITTGAATDLGMLSSNVIGLAIPTAPIAYAVDSTNNLLIFDPSSIGTPVSKPILSLQSGETILGIDVRPATGQLYALGSMGRIYTIGYLNGSATQVGSTVHILNGTDFGFDFNPTVDRIRIISNTGQNFRVNPNDGTLAATDTSLSPGTPNVTAAAYMNNYAGATLTALYVIDSTTDMLYIQNPPNGGILTNPLPLGVNVSASNGFDIGGNSGIAYAILNVGGTNGLYTINTTTGAATLVAAFPVSNIKGFSVGLGF